MDCVELNFCKRKQYRGAAFSLLLAIGSVLLLLKADNIVDQIKWVICVLVFLAAVLWAFWNLFEVKGPVWVFSEAGICSQAKFIDWKCVTSVRHLKGKYLSFISIRLTAAAEQQFLNSTFMRINRRFEKWFGYADPLLISGVAWTIDADEAFERISALYQSYGPGEVEIVRRGGFPKPNRSGREA